MSEIVSGARHLNLDDLKIRSARAAAGLASLGIGRGDSIAICLRNDLPFFEASMGAGIIGAYSVPVNWHFTASEARYLFENSGARAIVIHADLVEPIRGALPNGVPVLVVETPPEIATAYGLAAEACRVPAGMQNWGDWLEDFSPYDGAPQAAPGTIIYTSGTTGLPKGVRRPMPTREQADVFADVLQTTFGFTNRAAGARPVVTIVAGPMYHGAPNGHALYSARFGAKVISQPRFDPEGLLQLIEKHQVTHLHMVPIMFNRLLRLPDDIKGKYDLSSLEFVAHAAAPCPAPIKRAMIEWWGPVINEYYGSTETLPVTFCTSAQWLAHPGSVGCAMAHAEVQVFDADGNRLPVGQTGEVAAISRCDRAKDMIISGGANIYPAEIEAELQKMPGVEDCAVFGIPDEEFGEAVYAVVQVHPGVTLVEGDVNAYLRGQIAGFKVPKRVEFHALLPRKDSGKIFKRKLREPFWEGAERRI